MTDIALQVPLDEMNAEQIAEARERVEGLWKKIERGTLWARFALGAKMLDGMELDPPLYEDDRMMRYYSSPPCLLAAVDYAASGLHVFPAELEDGAKKSYLAAEYAPGGMNWGMSNDPKRVRKNFSKPKWRDKCGVGLPTGAVNGLFVIEGDTQKGHGIDGLAALVELQEKHGPLPETRMAASPTGSEHRYYRHPGNGFKVRSFTLVPGVDIKGDGGMVIAPPSLRPGVGRYHWLNDLPVADAPDWLLELVREEAAEPESGEENDYSTYAKLAQEKQYGASRKKVETALALLGNDVDTFYDTWVEIGHEIKSWDASDEVGWAVFEAFSATWPGRDGKVYDPEYTREKWTGFRPTRTNIGALFNRVTAKVGEGWWERAQEEEKLREPRALRFPLVPFHELVPSKERAYLVKGLIPRTGMVVIWGPPKCGKSFWTFTVLMHIALGWEYRARKVQQGPVVYCAFEGAAGFRARAEAFRQHHGLGDGNGVSFFLQPLRMSLVKDHRFLIADITKQIEAPAAVVLDTLNRSLDGSESSDEDMSAYINAADAIRETFDCVVVIVHHCGIDGTRPRGHTSLTGAVETQLAVERSAANDIVVTVEWMKDGPEGDQIVSKLETITVGEDEDGDSLTSCVVTPADPEEFFHPDGPTRKPPIGANKIALDLLRKAVKDAGETPPPNDHIPPNVMAVPVETWRRYCDQGTVTDSREPDSKSKAFRRARNALQAAGFIGVWTDWVWAVPFHSKG